MKKTLIILLISAMALGGTVITSCKKKTKDPDYPQLVGSWKGTTSQSIPIEIDVANDGGDLYVTYVLLKYTRAPGDTSTIMRSSSSGLSMLSGKSFTVVMEGTTPYQTLVQGTFRTDTLKLSGTFTGYTTEPPITPVTGTYTAGKSK